MKEINGSNLKGSSGVDPVEQAASFSREFSYILRAIQYPAEEHEIKIYLDWSLLLAWKLFPKIMDITLIFSLSLVVPDSSFASLLICVSISVY